MIQHNATKKGFTLIEVIIYIALLSIVLVFMMSIFQEMIFLKAKVNDKAEILDNAQFSMNKIVTYLRATDTLNSPQFSQTVNTLSIDTEVPSESPLLIYAENNVLKLKKGSADPVELTNDRVVVNALSFTNNKYGEQEDIIQVNLEIASAYSFWKNSPITLQTSVNLNE